MGDCAGGESEYAVPETGAPRKISGLKPKTSRYRGKYMFLVFASWDKAGYVVIYLIDMNVLWCFPPGVTLVCANHALPWRAQIWIGGRAKTLGRFASEEDAARAFDVAAKDHHKEKAVLNFPEPGGKCHVYKGVVAGKSMDLPGMYGEGV